MPENVIPEIELKNHFKKFEFETNGSLRDFSKLIGIDASTVSKIFDGKRKIPKSKAFLIADLLYRDSSLKKEFIKKVIAIDSSKSPRKEKRKTDYQILNAEERDMFLIITEWEYFAILNLVKLKKKLHTIKFFSESLGISTKRVSYCLEVLLKNNLIIYENGRYRRLAKKIETATEVRSRALQLSHLNEMDHIKTKVSLDVEVKSFRSNTFTINSNDVPKLKKIIEELYSKIDKLSESEIEGHNAVYLMASQLVPLSLNLSPRDERGEFIQ